MKTTLINHKGFTLLEMLLVIGVMSVILGGFISFSNQRMDQFRRDRAVIQMQQILNAGLAYYVQNGTWPVTCGAPVSLSGSPPTSLLQVNGFLPNKAMTGPWPAVGSYSIDCNGSGTSSNATGNFLVKLKVPNLTEAKIIAGSLPLAEVDETTDTVTAQVTVPGQNLNNARSLNYAGVYYSGACVPAPSCPSGMQPQIFVIPASVAGVYDQPQKNDGTPCSSSTRVNPDGSVASSGDCAQIAAYAMTSYEAYAYSDSSSGTAVLNATPQNCDGTNATTGVAGRTCYNDPNTAGTFNDISGKYWRVCLKVGTENGQVEEAIRGNAAATTINPRNNDNRLYWTQAMGKIIAFTRCVPQTEPEGSGLNVWSP